MIVKLYDYLVNDVIEIDVYTLSRVGNRGTNALLMNDDGIIFEVSEIVAKQIFDTAL